jgi:hypothetical protein
MWALICDNADKISKLGPLVAAASAFIAAIGAFYVFLQYKRAQLWRKGDLAAALLAKLESDDELAFACQSLDWGTGPILVPKRYLPLTARFNLANESVLEHSPLILAAALEPSLNRTTLESAQGLIYRHCFIKLFSHLDNIGRLVASGQIDVADLHGLLFWLTQLAKYAYPPAGRAGEVMFQPAIAVFDYPNIPILARQLGVRNWLEYDRARMEIAKGSDPLGIGSP